MKAGDTVGVIGVTMCRGHRGQIGMIVSDTTTTNHAGQPMRLVNLLPEHRTGRFGGKWWIEEDELMPVDGAEVAWELAGISA